ncbi:hypothetical protein ACOSP7_007270 [Xanthoceras sorbifolium]
MGLLPPLLYLFRRKLVMRQEANVGGSSAPEERKSCPFDEVVVEYERFMSKQRAIDCSKRAAKAHRGQVTGSSTFDHEEGGFKGSMLRLLHLGSGQECKDHT